jgi:hypothetical protein
MTHFGIHPKLELAEDPSDIVWRWFVQNGPHGNSFEWRRTTSIKSSVVILREFIEQHSQSVPNFKARAREIALKALKIDDELYIRKGIHVLTILGTDKDLEGLKEFVESKNKKISDDAKSGLFERGIKVKRKK